MKGAGRAQGGGPSRSAATALLARCPGLPGSALLFALVGVAAGIHVVDGDRYLQLVQEDGPVEWATVGLLLLAAAAFAHRAWGRRGDRRALVPLLGAVFCLAVAGEEISWGQRLLGYQPPEAFLAHNAQQELNLHNSLPRGLRKVALPLILLAYGLALPLLVRLEHLGRRLTRLGLEPPAPGLAPGFVLAAVLYILYPWRFTGEWVELLLAAGLAWEALLRTAVSPAAGPARSSLSPLPVFVTVALLSVGVSVWAREGRGTDPRRVAAARRELDALRADFRSGRLRTHCGLHSRIYRHLVEVSALARMQGGAFQALEGRGLPATRARFFLDPWNSPYWVEDRCAADGSREIVVYSLGGNRLRESSPGHVGGDDLQVVVASALPAAGAETGSEAQLGAR